MGKLMTDCMVEILNTCKNSVRERMRKLAIELRCYDKKAHEELNILKGKPREVWKYVSAIE